MEREGGARLDARTSRAFIFVSVVVSVLTFPGVVAGGSELQEGGPQSPVMLILRGIASPEYPRGQLDDESALEYARHIGYEGEVLDTAGDNKPESPQIKMAFERIRRDERVAAIYGFS